ncbi:tetratricopeptide repeat protein [uncultured Arcobacter sp.]|uniref:tetratricopeptide repeat protein n=1 Tax=uncultured Arcobacter sp. TaxID=165434 RepID=UPI002622A104|nr:tetratricopeptide repeat protein [uncultured Arcobacter sp.]
MIKKILLSTSIITSLLLANETFTSYDQAIKLFKEKNYKDAYEIFHSLSKSDLGNQTLNFYLGRSAYEQGEYDLAISYYERILFVEPNNSRVKVEVAQSNLMLKNYAQAIKDFNTVLVNANTPADVRKSIEARLAYIKRTMQKHFINGALVFDLSYDSNANNSATPGDYSVFTPQLGTVTLSNSAKEESDYTYDAIAIINHVYKYDEEFSLNNNLVIYTQDYDTKKDSNIDVISFSSTPTFYKGANKYSTGIGMDYVRYNDKAYLKSYNLILSNSHIFTQTTLNDITLKISKKLFDQETDKEKNAYAFNFIDALKYKTENYGLFTLNTSYIKELEIYEQRTDVSKETYELSLENSLALPYKLNLTTTLGSKKVIYTDTDVNFLSRRVDKINTFALGITRPLRKNLIFALKGTATNNISNQAPFDYKKHVIKSSLIYTF